MDGCLVVAAIIIIATGWRSVERNVTIDLQSAARTAVTRSLGVVDDKSADLNVVSGNLAIDEKKLQEQKAENKRTM